MPIDPVSLITIVATVISASAAVAAIIFATRQITLNRKALEAQTFVTLVNTARDKHFSQGMDIIRTLSYKNYDGFKAADTGEQAQIREVIDFLNDLQHMVNYGYLTEDHVAGLFLLSILDCKKHLLPWWLDGFRAENGDLPYYTTFEVLCETTYAHRDRLLGKVDKLKVRLKHLGKENHAA